MVKWRGMGCGEGGDPEAACFHCDLVPDKGKKMDGWMDGYIPAMVVNLSLLEHSNGPSQLVLPFV